MPGCLTPEAAADIQRKLDFLAILINQPAGQDRRVRPLIHRLRIFYAFLMMFGRAEPTQANMDLLVRATDFIAPDEVAMNALLRELF